MEEHLISLANELFFVETISLSTRDISSLRVTNNLPSQEDKSKGLL